MLPRDEAPVNPRQFLDSDSDEATCGLLRWTSPTPELNMVLELFLREVTGRMFRDVRAVYLFGSGALADLAPEHGDVDLIVALRRDPGRATVGEVQVLHKYFAGKMFGHWGRMLDTAYYSVAMLADPGKGGTGLHARQGKVKQTNKLHLGALERFSVHDHGVLLYGDDVRKQLLAPKPAELFDQVKVVLGRARKLEIDSEPGDYVAAITGLTRSLYALSHDKVASKTAAARWFADTYKGKEGDVALEANKLRRGELRTGIGGIRKYVPDYLDLVGSELAKLEKKLPKPKTGR